MNADVTDVTPLDDLDTLLGPAEETRTVDVPENTSQDVPDKQEADEPNN